MGLHHAGPLRLQACTTLQRQATCGCMRCHPPALPQDSTPPRTCVQHDAARQAPTLPRQPTHLCQLRVGVGLPPDLAVLQLSRHPHLQEAAPPGTAGFRGAPVRGPPPRLQDPAGCTLPPTARPRLDALAAPAAASSWQSWRQLEGIPGPGRQCPRRRSTHLRHTALDLVVLVVRLLWEGLQLGGVEEQLLVALRVGGTGPRRGG